MAIPSVRTLLAAFGVLLLAACDDGTAPVEEPALDFDRTAVALGEARVDTVVLRNTGSHAVGPVDVIAGPVQRAGLDMPGVAVLADPASIPTLNPGDSAIVAIVIEGSEDLQSGNYSAELHARVQGTSLASVAVSFLLPVPPELVGSVEIVDLPPVLRQGDLVQFTALVHDTLGGVIEDPEIVWSTNPVGLGLFTADNEFVPYTTGEFSLVATVGGKADTVAVEVAPRGVTGSFTVIGGSSETARYTSDVWVHGDVAYSGTWGFREEPGNAVYVWDISGADPVLTDSIIVDAFTVNDVKIGAAGDLAVLTQEHGAMPRAVTLLDMTDPAHPTVVSAFTGGEVDFDWIGVHNVWIEGDYVYLVVDGSLPTRGLWILDISDRANPVRVAQFYGGTSFLHDVYVRDGLAFLSHWDAGLIILDVGNGIMGGSPTNPVEVSRVQTLGGQTHNAWYWPETGYVFVGEEDFSVVGSPQVGYMHVVDASNLLNPLEVGSFRVAGDTPHNFWLDEERAILYMAWYSRGLQAIDVSGRLLGSLDRQGRVIASSMYSGEGPCPAGSVGTCTWAPQLHDGFVFVSDMNSGVWKLQPSF